MSAVFRKVPVSAYGEFAIFQFQQVPGRKLLDVQEGGGRIGYISELDVLPEGLAVDLSEFWRYREDCLDFGAKQQALTVKSIVQRLLPQAVARNQYFAAALVIQRQRKHAAQLVNAIAAQFLVQMDYHLGVAMRGEPVPPALQLGTELREVVDLAVENDPDGSILVKHRLVASSQIDDAKAAHPETG